MDKKLYTKTFSILLLCLLSLTAFGQQGNTYYGSTVYTPSNDNYGSVQISYEYAFNGTQMKIKITQVIAAISPAMHQNEPELVNELRRRGIMPFTQQSGAGVTIYYEGKVSASTNASYQTVPISGSVSGTMTDYAFFEPTEHMKEYSKTYYNNTKKNLYSETATLVQLQITKVLLNDLDQKIEAVRSELNNNKNRFAGLISQGTQAANQYDFAQAESALAEALPLADDNREMKAQADKLKGLIADKKQEKEKKEQEEKKRKEQEEKEKQEAEAKETAAASGGSSSSESSSEEKDKSEAEDSNDDSSSKEKSSQTVYRPKTNRELYDELKALTDANPALLNDPDIRVRLNSYKTMADRDDRNNRDYQSFKMITGGGYHPQTSAALNSIYQTNANIANAEMAVGGVVDAATSIANSIIEANNRKNEERQAAESRKLDAAMAKKEAIAKWEFQLKEDREAYEKETENKIKEDFNLIATIGDVPITYETEVYEEGDSYWQGQVQIFPHKFVKKEKVMASFNKIKTYNLYIVELNGLYGILGDNGEALYPPQFEGIYTFDDAGKRPRFLVNIKDKWGEILADGSIAEEIKYDGIWYTANKESKILKQGNNWQEKSVVDNRLLRQFSNSQIASLYSGGLIPVINTNEKKHNVSGSYSLSSDGQIYGFGETGNSDINSMEYESVRRGQTIERLYKINGKWFVTANYGTKNMTTIEMPQKFVVEALRETESGKKWGAIDQDGNIVVPFEHNFIKRTANGFTTDKGNYNIK